MSTKMLFTTDKKISKCAIYSMSVKLSIFRDLIVRKTKLIYIKK